VCPKALDEHTTDETIASAGRRHLEREGKLGREGKVGVQQ